MIVFQVSSVRKLVKNEALEELYLTGNPCCQVHQSSPMYQDHIVLNLCRHFPMYKDILNLSADSPCTRIIL